MITTNHIQQFNEACQHLEFTDGTINRIRNYICDDEPLTEDILESFFNNSQAMSIPMVVDWNNLVMHIWLDLDDVQLS